MNKIKATISVIIHVALGVYILMAIWSGVQPSNDGYNTKTDADVIPLVSTTSDEMTSEEVDGESVDESSESDIAAVVEEVTEGVSTTSDQAVETAVTAVETKIEEVKTAVEEAVVAVKEEVAEVTSGAAQVHVVTAEGLKYNPLVVTIAVGDTVAWDNMSSHDTQSLEGFIFEGVEMWHSSMGENYQRTFTVEGIYVYKCTPHFGAGMGGAIIVGKPTNLEAIKAADVAGAAKRLVKKAIQTAEAL
jgi:pseudoazurin